MFDIRDKDLESSFLFLLLVYYNLFYVTCFLFFKVIPEVSNQSRGLRALSP